MFIKDLQQEKGLLIKIQQHHISQLNAINNPSGILLCQKHKNGFRWQHRFLEDDHPVTIDIRKTKSFLAQQLAVNLYRYICIQYLQKQIDLINKTIRIQQPGVTHINVSCEENHVKNFGIEEKIIPLWNSQKTCYFTEFEIFRAHRQIFSLPGHLTGLSF